MSESLDAVYYSQQVPNSPASLTALGMVFDRIYFPGVYIPSVDLDREAVVSEIKRIQTAVKRPSIADVQLLQCMGFSLHKKHLEDFCIFTASPSDTFGRIEKETPDVAARLEEMIYGPPEPGFTPSFESGHAVGMPGNKMEAIRYPGWLYYPANALVFAAKNNLPLVNDNPNLPVPGLSGASPKDNAKLLAAILTVESIRVAMPEIPVLTPEELAEFRSEVRVHVKPFRNAILGLAKQINSGIKADAKIADVQASARFLVETTVAPAVEELRGVLADTRKFWYRKAVKYGVKAPTLVGAFYGLSNTAIGTAGAALVTLLSMLAEGLVELRDAQIDKDEKIRRGQYYYLLEMQDKLKKP